MSAEQQRRAKSASDRLRPPVTWRWRLWATLVIVGLVGLLAFNAVEKESSIAMQTPTSAPHKIEYTGAIARLRESASARSRVRQTEDVTDRRDGGQETDDDERNRQENVDDPVGFLIPLLTGQSPEQQLEYLKWARRLPESGFVSIFPDLAAAHDMNEAERAELGLSALNELVEILEAEGTKAPNLPEGFNPVQIVNDPPPVEMPPSLRDTYNPHPSDSHRLVPANPK
jgi:hypothetical protein